MADDDGTNKRNRLSIRDLEKNEKERFAFLKAFDAIRNLPADDPDSYWSIASINGQPFTSVRSTKPESKEIWRADSQHQNVLFLPWYRAYLLHLENALVKHAPVDSDSVALPYWDETSPDTLTKGLPDLLMDDFVEIDEFGNTIPNPLIGYTLPKPIPLANATQKYTKAAGYTTCRYPFSGLMNPQQPNNLTINAQIQNNYLGLIFRDPKIYLNQNVLHSLNGLKPSIHQIYNDCLEIDDYNEFSNIQSANGKHSLELASINMLHTLGGNDNQFELIAGSHGDLGANEMAAFDPLFFLHMANVDRMFWSWQVKYGFDTTGNPFKITHGSNDQGVKPKNGQGPSPNQQGDQTLTMSTPLHPFKAKNSTVFLKTNDLIVIDYKYIGGSLLTCEKVSKKFEIKE